MKNKVYTISLFEVRYKRLVKKFPSLAQEIIELQNQLIENPEIGVKLTANIYKIRIPNKDNQRGKSGGFRVITYLIEEWEDCHQINLITIYDKSEESTMTKTEVLKILKKYF